ncbi:hypothetical protein R3P38DRAFT_3205977 [Favolaschia claudopus]|uniref:Uncharacterized protein n=1 Tax=Favolaschia claudopus TaxID=2862362 RepID=A0AAW0AMM6_9AGAR
MALSWVFGEEIAVLEVETFGRRPSTVLRLSTSALNDGRASVRVTNLHANPETTIITLASAAQQPVTLYFLLLDSAAPSVPLCITPPVPRCRRLLYAPCSLLSLTKRKGNFNTVINVAPIPSSTLAAYVCFASLHRRFHPFINDFRYTVLLAPSKRPTAASPPSVRTRPRPPLSVWPAHCRCTLHHIATPLLSAAVGSIYHAPRALQELISSFNTLGHAAP